MYLSRLRRSVKSPILISLPRIPTDSFSWVYPGTPREALITDDKLPKTPASGSKPEGRGQIRNPKSENPYAFFSCPLTSSAILYNPVRTRQPIA
jgi:hypothetical protein